jgi:hypothetical protein
MKVDGTNLSMIRGDSEVITVSCTNNNNTKVSFVNGEDTVYFTVKLNTATDVKLIQKVITTFVDGNAIIDIEPDDTKSLLYKTYKYDIQQIRVVGASTRVTTLVGPAMFILENEVTFETTVD